MEQQSQRPSRFQWVNSQNLFLQRLPTGKVYLATFSNKLIVYGLNAPTASHCPNPLPAVWRSADIGYVFAPGDVCYNNGAYTIAASGNDIWDNADAFHSVFQPVLGSNTDITARVVSITATDPWAKCGGYVSCKSRCRIATRFYGYYSGKRRCISK